MINIVIADVSFHHHIAPMWSLTAHHSARKPLAPIGDLGFVERP